MERGTAGCRGAVHTSLTFTTTVRMVVRVHNRTADSRSDTHVTLTSCFTNVDQAVISVSYDTDRCSTNDWNHSHL